MGVRASAVLYLEDKQRPLMRIAFDALDYQPDCVKAVVEHGERTA